MCCKNISLSPSSFCAEALPQSRWSDLQILVIGSCLLELEVLRGSLEVLWGSLGVRQVGKEVSGQESRRNHGNPRRQNAPQVRFQPERIKFHNLSSDLTLSYGTDWLLKIDGLLLTETISCLPDLVRLIFILRLLSFSSGPPW